MKKVEPKTEKIDTGKIKVYRIGRISVLQLMALIAVGGLVLTWVMSAFHG